CAFLVGPWTERNPDEYLVAAGMIGLGIVLWALTWLFDPPSRGAQASAFDDEEEERLAVEGGRGEEQPDFVARWDEGARPTELLCGLDGALRRRGGRQRRTRSAAVRRCSGTHPLCSGAAAAQRDTALQRCSGPAAHRNRRNSQNAPAIVASRRLKGDDVPAGSRPSRISGVRMVRRDRAQSAHIGRQLSTEAAPRDARRHAPAPAQRAARR